MKEQLDYLWKGLITILMMISAWGAMRVVSDVDKVKQDVQQMQLDVRELQTDMKHLKNQP